MGMGMPARAADARDVLLRSNDGGVAVLTLNRPQARNALSEGLIDALSAQLDVIAQERATKAVVITASPGPCFSSGHDLKEMTAHRADADRGRAYYEGVLGRCSAMMQRIVRLPQPVIAAVETLATAAGCQLVTSCDLAVASESARFCTPGVHIGLFCSTPMVALSRAVSRKHSMEMLLTGETIPASDAMRMGLVNRIAPTGQALDGAMELARVIATKSGPVLAIGKRAFYEQMEMGLADAYAHASRVMTENMLARDAEEGIGAFLEKREPQWE